MKKNIGFVFADDMEFKPFLEYAISKGGKMLVHKPQNVVFLQTERFSIFAIESGIGKVNAALAALELIYRYKVQYILNAGLSGAVSSLKKGDIVAGESYVECDFDLTPLDYKLGCKPTGQYIMEASSELLNAASKVDGLQIAKLGTGDVFLTDPVRKKLYKETFGVNAFDMESAALASTCQRYEIPFLSIRKVSDDADDLAKDSYREMNKLGEIALTEVLIKVIDNL